MPKRIENIDYVMLKVEFWSINVILNNSYVSVDTISYGIKNYPFRSYESITIWL